MEANKFLKIILISNIFTALVSMGAFYYSYQAFDNAESAYYSSANASSEAENTSNLVSEMKYNGVTCK